MSAVVTEQSDKVSVTKDQLSQPSRLLTPSPQSSQEQQPVLDSLNTSFEMVERGPTLTNPQEPTLQGNSRLRPLHLKWIIGLLIGLVVASCGAHIALS